MSIIANTKQSHRKAPRPYFECCQTATAQLQRQLGSGRTKTSGDRTRDHIPYSPARRQARPCARVDRRTMNHEPRIETHEPLCIQCWMTLGHWLSDLANKPLSHKCHGSSYRALSPSAGRGIHGSLSVLSVHNTGGMRYILIN